jgi:hypothetical protein
MKEPMTMTDEQAKRIAQINARRSTASNGVRGPNKHKARKSRAVALGLSVAAASGLISGMWTQAGIANAEPAAPADTALQPVVVPGQQGQPDRIVYLVVTKPSSSTGADTLRSTTTTTEPPQAQVPTQTITPTPRAPIVRTPVTRSHGSR